MAQTAVQDSPTRFAPLAAPAGHLPQAGVPHAIDLVAGTPVMTMLGVVPVEQIAPDDRIITRAGAMRVQSVEQRIVNQPEILRIAARALGHDRPDQDVLLPADQPVLLRDWRAKAMFGTTEATVAAKRLIDGLHVRGEDPRQMRMIRLVLPRAAVIYAGGLELAAVPAPVTA